MTLSSSPPVSPLLIPHVVVCLPAQTHLSHPQPLRSVACSRSLCTTAFCAFQPTHKCRTHPTGHSGQIRWLSSLKHFLFQGELMPETRKASVKLPMHNTLRIQTIKMIISSSTITALLLQKGKASVTLVLDYSIESGLVGTTPQTSSVLHLILSSALWGQEVLYCWRAPSTPPPFISTTGDALQVEPVLLGVARVLAWVCGTE